jgi:adenylate cyclase
LTKATDRDRDREFVEAGLLDDVPEGTPREARLELLRELAQEGVSLDELRQAVAENRLVFLLLDRVLAEEPRYTSREVAEQVGLPLDYLLAARKAAGLALPDPDETAYSDQDLKAARIIAELRSSGIPDEGLLEITRVLGRGLAQGAEAIRSVAARAFIESGGSEYQLARRNAQAASYFLPMLAPLLQNILRLHLRDMVRNQAISQEDLIAGTAGHTSHVFVAFADIVGFTRLGERVEIGELGELGARLTELALQYTKPPARLVKTIGDAVMFVAPAAEPLLDTVLDLVEQVEEDDDEFPRLRAGIAAGLAVSREGDWYGPPVNLASRVTGVARPGSVLATDEVRDAAGDGYAWSAAGARELKGLKRRIPMYRVRRQA